MLTLQGFYSHPCRIQELNHTEVSKIWGVEWVLVVGYSTFWLEDNGWFMWTLGAFTCKIDDFDGLSIT